MANKKIHIKNIETGEVYDIYTSPDAIIFENGDNLLNIINQLSLIWNNPKPTDIDVGALKAGTVLENLTLFEIISKMVYSDEPPIVTQGSFDSSFSDDFE